MVAHESTDSSRQYDIPRTSGTIARTALYDTLAAYQSHRVILVTAPTGYGKTTAVAQFIDYARVPAAWHTIDERDRDLANLQSNTLKAISSIAPSVPDFYDPDRPLPPRDGALYISNQLRDSIDEHFMLVLDDLHLLAGAIQTETWLQHLVEYLPPKCHLVLISRAVPDLPLAELIVKRAIVAIGQDKLRFTESEAAALARMLGSSVTEEQVHQRVKHLEGWPAGLVMSLQPLPNELEVSLLKGQQGPEALFYELAENTLQKQSPVLRDFLLSSSVLSRLTPELCARILGITDSANALITALSRGLYVTQVSGGYVYHRLFRSFLQSELKRRNPRQFTELHARAGQWFYTRGDSDSAFDHFITAELYKEALTVVEQSHMAYFSQGKVETLLMWRTKLGDHARHVPYLLYKCAIIYTERYQYTEAEAALDDARYAFEQNGDRIGLADVELQQAMIMRRRGDYQQVIHKMNRLLGEPALPERITARARQFLALSYLALGDTPHAIHLLEEIVPIYQANGDLYALSTVLQDMEIAYTRQGDVENASRCLQELVAIRRQLRNPDALALALNNLGYHYHQRHRYKEARATFEEGLQIVEHTSNRRAESYLRWSLGDLQRDLGQFDEAQMLYDSAYELSSGMESALNRSITLSMSTLYRWRGEYSLAGRLAREVAAQSGKTITPDDLMAQAKMWIAWAFEAANQRNPIDPRQALEALEKILYQLSDLSAPAETRLCALYCAEACLFSENRPLADHYLSEAFGSPSDPQRQCQPEIVAEIAHVSPLRAHINRQPRYRAISEMVEKLLKVSAVHPVHKKPAVTLTLPDQTYSLQVYTLGSETIERNGLAVPSSAWRADRAREFFLYLLLEGPQTRDTISLTFWPDSPVKRVRSNFHTTLYRARNALGENVVIFDDELYRINPMLDIMCDALVLEDSVKQARLLQAADPLADELYQRAIHLYNGDFLPSVDAAWVDIHRQRFFELYIDALLGAGQCARARRDYRGSIVHYRRALELDPYREGVHRAILMSYSDLGETSQLINHFRKMEKIFRDDLGVSPSPETVSLVKALSG